jgi:peptide/nickel transport system permease protein
VRRGSLAAAALLALHAAALVADFVAPYPASQQARSLPWAPPSRIHVRAPDGGLARPYVHALRELPGRFGEYEEDVSRRYPVRFFVRGEPYTWLGVTFRTHLFGVEPGARVFLLGSDGLGRDQLSRLLLGARVSLFAGLLAAGLSLGLGLVLGCLAGYYGGLLDGLLMRLVELFLALPWFYLLLGVRAFLPLTLEPWQSFALLVLAIGLLDWAQPARLVRGVAASARQREYVLAARGFGAGDAYLLRRHVAPQTYAVLLTQAALSVPQYVLAEITLTYLGFGISDGGASLGLLIATLGRVEVMREYWWTWLPALALVGLFFGYYRLADALGGRVGHVAT